MRKYQSTLNIITILLVCFTFTTSLEVHKWGKKWKRYREAKRVETHTIWEGLSVKYPVALKKSFVIVIASYNNEAVCEHNLWSVFDQTYDHYRVIYIDDCSTDKTYDKVKNFIKMRGQEDRVTLIRNTKRQLKLANLYNAYHSCKDHEIIVCLDGDDWLAHENVLKTVNQYYQNPNVWLTYGSAIDHPLFEKKDGKCLSDRVLLSNSIRDTPFQISMLRTFYAGLFKKIKLKDLLYQGNFLPSADDFAFMIPMIEMAPTHTLFIPDTLYVINDSNPIRENHTISNLQVNLMHYLKSKEKYTPLDTTFDPQNISTPASKTPLDIIILSNDASDVLQRVNSARSNYVVVATDPLSFDESMDMANCIQQMELTGALCFFIQHNKPPLSGLQLGNGICALSLENVAKIPELLEGSFIAIFQKKALLDAISPQQLLARISHKNFEKGEPDRDLDWVNRREDIIQCDKASGDLSQDLSRGGSDFRKVCEKCGLDGLLKTLSSLKQNQNEVALFY